MNAISVDRTTLPAALLAIAKEHLRVRHTRDDLLITQYIAQAIDAVERRCSINLNPAVYALDPCTLDAAWPCITRSGAARLLLPVNNVQSFTLEDADNADQSVGYTIEQADMGGAFSAYLVGPPISGSGWALALNVGVDTLEVLSPAVTAAVLRLTGGYYENRESPSAVVADDFLSELVAVWRPGA
jgi:uncharacterized phiE125 gp8 family phage protein